jgi:F0F1-type ATP synthase gamma subunit
MKYLILLEGGTEKALVEILIEQQLFIISIDDMLDMQPLLYRQIENSMPHALIRQLPSDEKVQIIRIGDKMSDKIKIPNDIKHKIVSVIKYCTKPELEMLIIISEGLYDEYQKFKKVLKPSEFVKSKIKYNKSYSWVKNYFQEKDIYKILKIYKQKAKHKKEEKYLFDLIKKD